MQHKKVCGYCDGDPHKRTNCPAARCGCYKCGRKGHFAKVCRTENKRYDYLTNAAPVRQVKEQDSHLAMLSAANFSDASEKVNVFLMVNSVLANGLIDTGAKHHHIISDFCQRLGICSKNNDDNMSLDLAVQGSAVKTKVHVLHLLNFVAVDMKV